MQVVATGPVMSNGGASGLRIVKVLDDKLEQSWHTFGGEFPTLIELPKLDAPAH